MTILTKEEVIDKAVKACKQHIYSKRVDEIIIPLPKPELDGHEVIYNDERESRIGLSFSPPSWLHDVADNDLVPDDAYKYQFLLEPIRDLMEKSVSVRLYA